MFEASIQGILKIILIILLIYYGLKVVTRLFGPLLFKYVTKKAGEKFQQQFDQGRPTQQTTEGEVTIDKKPKRNTSHKDVGEYIDFEEIE